MKKYVILKKEEIVQSMLTQGAAGGGNISPSPIMESDGETGTGYYVLSTFDEFADALRLFKKLTLSEYNTEVAAIQAGNEPSNKLVLTQETHNVSKGEQIIVSFAVPASPGILDLPGDSRYNTAYLRNDGANKIRFNVDFDPTATGMSLDPGQISPPIDVKGATLVRVTGVGGASTVEFLSKS